MKDEQSLKQAVAKLHDCMDSVIRILDAIDRNTDGLHIHEEVSKIKRRHREAKRLL